MFAAITSVKTAMRIKDTATELWPALVSTASLPIHERVVDRVADLLFEADELMSLLASEDGARMRAVQSQIRQVYEQLDALMRQLTD